MHKISRKRLVKPLIFVFTAMIIFKVAKLVADPCAVEWEDGSIYLDSTAMEIEIIDRFSTVDGYYIFLPKRNDNAKSIKSVVGFIHGYGALNPKIFGGWIKHLVENGNVVIYPRYQYNLLMPSSDEFTKHSGNALQSALLYLDETDRLDEDYKFNLVGHSFGGVISANLLLEYEHYGLPKPSSALIAEGGTGPLTGAIMDSYHEIEKDIMVIITVGAKDYTVGGHFGEKLFGEIQNDHAVFIFQKPLTSDSLEIGASHYEPYCLDDWCDNEMDNITSKRAEYVAKNDVLDKHGYWKWLDTLISASFLPIEKRGEALRSRGVYDLGGLRLDILDVSFLSTP